MIYARHEGVVVQVRERGTWPIVLAAFLEPLCPVVGCVGSALCEVLRADDEVRLLSGQQALRRGCCWRGLSLSTLSFEWAGVFGGCLNCRRWEGGAGVRAVFGGALAAGSVI
jgi:hypothetical protein